MPVNFLSMFVTCFFICYLWTILPLHVCQTNNSNSDHCLIKYVNRIRLKKNSCTANERLSIRERFVSRSKIVRQILKDRLTWARNLKIAYRKSETCFYISDHSQIKIEVSLLLRKGTKLHAWRSDTHIVFKCTDIALEIEHTNRLHVK